jgi:hypothetical protein
LGSWWGKIRFIFQKKNEKSGKESIKMKRMEEDIESLE